MKKILSILLLLSSLFGNAQIKIKDLPTTTTGVVGDFLLKDDVAGIPGSTKKINITNFKATYFPNLFTGTLTSPLLPYATGAQTLGNSWLGISGNNVYLSSGKFITSQDATKVQLDFGTTGSEYYSATSDGGTFGEGWQFFDPSVSQIGYGSNSVSVQKDESGGSTTKGILIKQNTINAASSLNSANPAIIIGSQNATVNNGVTNSVIIGGSGRTASANNTLYATNIDAAGTFKYVDGNQGASKVLTSDASGNATWSTPASSISGLTTNYFPKATSSTTIGNSPFYQLGHNFIVPSGYKISNADTAKSQIDLSYGGVDGVIGITPDGGLFNQASLYLTPTLGQFQFGDGSVAATHGYVSLDAGQVELNHGTRVRTAGPEFRIASTNFTIATSSFGLGKVLTSDASGGATWQTPAGGSGTVTSIATGNGITGGTITTTGTLGLSGATGDIGSFSGTNTYSAIAGVSAGSYLRSGGVSTLPVWSTTKLLNAGTANYIPYWSSTNTEGESANLTFDGTTLLSATQMQTPILQGNTTASGTLTLKSTSNATKGKLLFGTSAYDEVNNALGIGTTAPFGFNGSQFVLSGASHVYAQMDAGTGSKEATFLFSRSSVLRYAFGMGAAVTPNFYVYDYGAARYILYGVNGNAGFGNVTNPTARIHLGAGTATASTAPLKFTSGTNLTTAEAGSIEYDGSHLFFSPSTTRLQVATILTGSATLDFGNTLAGNVTDLTITVTGAADGDPVDVGIPNGSYPATGTFNAWVSATNTVTVRYANNSLTIAQDPASGTFKVTVNKN